MITMEAAVAGTESFDRSPRNSRKFTSKLVNQDELKI